MARIAGVDLPRGKRIEVALTYIYGIGSTRAKQILDACGVDPDRRAQDVSDDDVNRIRRQIEGDFKVEGDAPDRAFYGYQAADGYRLLSWVAAPPRPSGSWSAH